MLVIGGLRRVHVRGLCPYFAVKMKQQNRDTTQLIIATHSERVIRTARREDLRLLSGELHTVPKLRSLIGTLQLSNVDLVQAQLAERILYVEGEDGPGDITGLVKSAGTSPAPVPGGAVLETCGRGQVEDG